MYSPDIGNGSIAYLTTAYPHVSHTFIRREIMGLEALGYAIRRAAIRCGAVLVDAIDEQECKKTLHVLEQPKLAFIGQILHGLMLAGLKLGTATHAAWQLSKPSERGLARHMAYLVEALALRAYFERKRVAHVHVHFGTNAAAVAMLVQLLGGPSFSITCHGPDEFDAPIALSLGVKTSRARFVVATSHYCAAQLRRWTDYSQWDKIHVVRCTVDDAWFDASVAVADSPSSLLTIGRFSAQKGQLMLLDAYADAVSAGLRSPLVMVGDGELRVVIEARIAALGLAGRVQLTGWTDAPGIRVHLSNCRAVVLPSFAEGLPVVLMEAMAFGRPVVTTSVAGIPELVRDGEHGWLVPAGDRASLAGALLAVDTAPVEQLRAMGMAAQQAVRRSHSMRSEVGKLHELFAKVR